MEKREEEQIRLAMDDFPELRSLWEEHVQLEKKLDTLNHKHLLTPEEELERKHLQKVKLAGKDRMMMLVHQFHEVGAGTAKSMST